MILERDRRYLSVYLTLVCGTESLVPAVHSSVGEHEPRGASFAHAFSKPEAHLLLPPHAPCAAFLPWLLKMKKLHLSPKISFIPLSQSISPLICAFLFIELVGVLAMFRYQACAHLLWASYSLGLSLKPEYSGAP